MGLITMMPGGSGKDAGDAVQQTFDRLDWDAEARALVEMVDDLATRENIGLRAEKSARRDASDQVMPAHVKPFLEEAQPAGDKQKITWKAASLARLNRVPEDFRDQVRASIEAHALAAGARVIEGDVAEAGFAAARMGMCPVDPGGTDD